MAVEQRFHVNPAGRGQVELLGDTPNELSATVSLPKIPMLCQQETMQGVVLHYAR
jgi:hypothetical protein